MLEGDLSIPSKIFGFMVTYSMIIKFFHDGLSGAFRLAIYWCQKGKGGEVLEILPI